MREAESSKFSVGVPNQNEGGGQKKITTESGFYKYDFPNLEDIIAFIKNKNLAPETEKFLIDKAKKTPHGSLGNFRKNYSIYIKNMK